MAATAAVRQRNIVANLSRHHPDSPDLDDARRALAETKIEAYIRKTVDAAPPLTVQQRERLAALLRPAGGAHVA